MTSTGRGSRGPAITVFSQCRVADPEDVFVVHRRKAGVVDACVADGVSGFHSPRVSNRRFRDGPGEEVTGGQAVGKILQRTFLDPPEQQCLAEILLEVNVQIAAFAQRHAIPLDRPDDLPAVHIAAARVGPELIDIVTTGDCFAVWVLASGQVGATPDLEREFSRRERPERERLEKLYGSRESAWTHIEDSFRQWRRELTNVTYATLNGQPGVERLWCTETLRREQVRLLLLFTDGLVDPEDMADEMLMGRRVVDFYKQGGWPAVLHARRAPALGEATGVAIEFPP